MRAKSIFAYRYNARRRECRNTLDLIDNLSICSQATPTAYLTGIPGASTQVGNTYTPYFSAAGPLIGPTTIITSDPNNPLAMAVQQTMVTQQKMPRNDRLDVSKHLCRFYIITGGNIDRYDQNIVFRRYRFSVFS